MHNYGEIFITIDGPDAKLYYDVFEALKNATKKCVSDTFISGDICFKFSSVKDLYKDRPNLMEMTVSVAFDPMREIQLKYGEGYQQPGKEKIFFFASDFLDFKDIEFENGVVTMCVLNCNGGNMIEFLKHILPNADVHIWYYEMDEIEIAGSTNDIEQKYHKDKLCCYIWKYPEDALHSEVVRIEELPWEQKYAYAIEHNLPKEAYSVTKFINESITPYKTV